VLGPGLRRQSKDYLYASLYRTNPQ
jgi:hypothetical protein